MNLGDFIRELDTIGDDVCLYVKRPWSPASEAILEPIGGHRLPDHLSQAGYDYFIEPYVLRDEVFGEWAGSLSDTERCAVAIYYAEFDAYPDWLNQRLRS